MNFWVIQDLRGVISAIGPYKSQSARDNRLEKIRGGEVSAFRSLETEPKRVISEYKDERIGVL